MHWQAANCGTAVPAIPLRMMDIAYPAARSNRPFSLDEFPPKRRIPALVRWHRFLGGDGQISIAVLAPLSGFTRIPRQSAPEP